MPEKQSQRKRVLKQKYKLQDGKFKLLYKEPHGVCENEVNWTW